MNLCGERKQYQGFDVRTIRHTLTHGIEIVILSIWLQSTPRLRERFCVRSNQMCVLRHYPS